MKADPDHATQSHADHMDALCSSYSVFQPDSWSAAVYQELNPLYRKLHFTLGQKDANAAAIGDVLPEIRRIAAVVRAPQ